METVITIILFINIVFVALYFIMRTNKHPVDNEGQDPPDAAGEETKRD